MIRLLHIRRNGGRLSSPSWPRLLTWWRLCVQGSDRGAQNTTGRSSTNHARGQDRTTTSGESERERQRQARRSVKVSFQGYNQPWHRPRGSRKGFARKAMKTRFLIRSVIAVLALPVMVAGVIPGWLLLTLRGAIGAGLPKPRESHRGGNR